MEGPSSRASTGLVVNIFYFILVWMVGGCKVVLLNDWFINKDFNWTLRRYYAEPVVNGIPYSVKGYRGSARLYSVQVFLTDIYMSMQLSWFQVAGDGEGYLNIMANGGVGDIDIYVRFDEYPTLVQKYALICMASTPNKRNYKTSGRESTTCGAQHPETRNRLSLKDHSRAGLNSSLAFIISLMQ